jgi:hypothetical protein
LKAIGLRTFAEMTQSVERAERLLASHDKWVKDCRRRSSAPPPSRRRSSPAPSRPAAKGDAKTLAAARKAFAGSTPPSLLSFPPSWKARSGARCSR